MSIDAGTLIPEEPDCGGIWGYEHNLAVLADKNHPEHAEILEWMGGEIDPEDFNGIEVNERLKHLY